MKSKGGFGFKETLFAIECIFYSPFVCHIVGLCFGIEWFPSEREREREREMNWEFFWFIVCDEYTVGS